VPHKLHMAKCLERSVLTRAGAGHCRGLKRSFLLFRKRFLGMQVTLVGATIGSGSEAIGYRLTAIGGVDRRNRQPMADSR